MGRRCAVAPCFVRNLPDGWFFCQFHWLSLLTPAQRERLAKTWGWREWAETLQRTVRIIREVEARLPEPHDRW